ncbi:ABC transporter substrate-binding protein [Nesterenkonia muleiensis]|uniref:ABC transporter substrate-binding protein n=1 Tax=Nesterenkonia muleiensis TaxID=2282648 RepID=UPI000E74C6D9|nr:ABC transporter substrate-binding protein [Nesterenkonia muleiensis]
MNRASRVSAAASVAALLGLVGCSSHTADPAAGTDSPIIENCGFDLPAEPTPERVVTIKSTPLELMLALDLSELVVGAAFLDGPPPEELLPRDWEVPVLAEELPGREALLAAEPDVVFAGWESNLSADGIGTREDLSDMGLRSYIAPPACEFGQEASPLRFEDIFEMITEVGVLFAAEDRAAALIDEQRTALEGIEEPESPQQLLWYSSGEETPFVGGGTGAPQMIIEAAGHTNVGADHPETWFSMPWESFVDSDPDIIVLVDAPWHTAADKRQRLESHAAAQHMTAVQQEQFVVVDFATTEAGVRNIEAVQTLAESIHVLVGDQ